MRNQGMFNLHDEEENKTYEVSAIHNRRGYKQIRRNLSASYETAAMIPDIQIVNADITGSRELSMIHESYKGRKLDKKTASQVLTHVQRLWGYDVKMLTMSDNKLLDIYKCSAPPTKRRKHPYR